MTENTEDAARTARRAALVDMLTALGHTRQEAMQTAAEASVAMRPLVREAVSLGLMPTQLERITGVTRRALYDWLAEDDRSPE
ncbi:hypothetical protein [Pseudonocardia sp. D17]|uniref:hypothetical protein n=1 Tax=Pseudonocardia sp. D17 TaxID=882661 RepID=UPI0030CD88BA